MIAPAKIVTCLFASLAFTTLLVAAPVPPEAPPDPMARGYMGITVATSGLTIERVEPGMPSEKAGLRSGDVIARIGTLEPSSFDQVVSHICSFRPGAVVEIEVTRNGERRTFRVKLAARPPELDAPNRPPVRPRPIDIDD
jgi:S1-C subfamily serine protease